MNLIKILLVQFLCLLLIETHILSQAHQNSNYKQIGSDRYEYSFKINSNLPIFKFIVFTEPSLDARAVSSIVVKQKDSDTLNQKLKMPEELIDDFSPEKCVVKDMNFDGYLDFMLMSAGGSAGVAYAIWLYDPATREFNLDNDFEDIYDPEPNPLTKTISSSFSEGWRYNRRNTYKYDKSKLVLIRSVEDTFSESINRHVITTTLFESGKQTSVEVDTLAEEK